MFAKFDIKAGECTCDRDCTDSRVVAADEGALKRDVACLCALSLTHFMRLLPLSS